MTICVTSSASPTMHTPCSSDKLRPRNARKTSKYSHPFAYSMFLEERERLEIVKALEVDSVIREQVPGLPETVVQEIAKAYAWFYLETTGPIVREYDVRNFRRWIAKIKRQKSCVRRLAAFAEPPIDRVFGNGFDILNFNYLFYRIYGIQPDDFRQLLLSDSDDLKEFFETAEEKLAAFVNDPDLVPPTVRYARRRFRQTVFSSLRNAGLQDKVVKRGSLIDRIISALDPSCSKGEAWRLDDIRKDIKPLLERENSASNQRVTESAGVSSGRSLLLFRT